MWTSSRGSWFEKVFFLQYEELWKDALNKLASAVCLRGTRVGNNNHKKLQLRVGVDQKEIIIPCFLGTKLGYSKHREKKNDILSISPYNFTRVVTFFISKKGS